MSMPSSSSKKFVFKDEDNSIADSVIVTASDIINKQTKTPSSTYDTSAFSIAKHNNQWMLLEIPINSLTGETGEWKWVSDDGTKAGATNSFKVAVYKAGLMTGV